MSDLAPTASHHLLVSELFHSVQGEGRYVGAPSVFLRLARCNLTCVWCDTAYSWDFTRFDYAKEVSEQPVAQVVRSVLDFGAPRLVLTGGEPLLQQKAVVVLLGELDRGRAETGAARLFVEVETNGTVPPRAELIERVDHFNVSPKLASSGEPDRRRLRQRTLERLRDTGRADLKLVVGEADFAEADALIEDLNWPRERVVFMPEAADRAMLRERGSVVSAAALVRNVRYSSRLHVELFDGRRGT